MREVAHSIISNSMCHFHSCSQTMGFRAWTRTFEEMDGKLQIGNFHFGGYKKLIVIKIPGVLCSPLGGKLPIWNVPSISLEVCVQARKPMVCEQE